MNINLNNYEAYFLDYHEGNLAPFLVKELMDFVAQHPELKEEFESFEPVSLTDIENIEFDKKELLKKPLKGISAANFDECAIQYIEGTLPGNLQNELKAFISQNPSYQKELDLYAKTKLVPDKSIVFEDKFLLRKGNKRPAAWFYWSAAASVAIIIGTYFLLNRNSNPIPIPNGNNIVKHNQHKDSDQVANHVPVKIDSGIVAPKVSPNIPANSNVKNTGVVINGTPKKQHKKEITLPINKNNDSGIVRMENILPSLLPIRLQNNIPYDFENPAASAFETLQDTTAIYAWMKKYQPANNNPPDYAFADETKNYKRGKFLYLLAKYTCKGLHTITGQHINFEKRYDSDTTNIIAYQLDLGNKKINFPVKE